MLLHPPTPPCELVKIYQAISIPEFAPKLFYFPMSGIPEGIEADRSWFSLKIYNIDNPTIVPKDRNSDQVFYSTLHYPSDHAALITSSHCNISLSESCSRSS
jgi:hypothetical protein